MAASGADGVMIGRGAMGQPWIFAQLRGRPLPEPDERLDVMAGMTMTHEFYGDEAGPVLLANTCRPICSAGVLQS